GAAAGALGEVLGDGHQGVLVAAQAEPRGVGPLGEVRAARGTAQAADALAPAGPAVPAQVALMALAVGSAVRVRASKVREGFRAPCRSPPFQSPPFLLHGSGRIVKPYEVTTKRPGPEKGSGTEINRRSEIAPSDPQAEQSTAMSPTTNQQTGKPPPRARARPLPLG